MFIQLLLYIRGARVNTGSPDSKQSACNAGDLGSFPGLGRSLGERNGRQVFLPGEF